MMLMLVVVIMIAAMVVILRNDEDSLHVKVGKESRPPLLVLKDELGPVMTISFSISCNIEIKVHPKCAISVDL